jgi:hypothetical protein
MAAIDDYSRQFGLEYITKDLSVEFTPHRAADDAYATMKIVEAMCKREALSYLELEKKFGIKRGTVRGEKVTKPTSSGFIAYCDKREKQKQERAKNRTKFYIYLSRRKAKKSGKLLNNTFTFSRNLEDDLTISLDLVGGIYEHGGIYSQKLESCSIYVCAEEDNSVRTQNAKKNKNLKIISVEELRELLND